MPFVPCFLQVMTSDTNSKKKVEIWPAIIIHNGKHSWCDTRGIALAKRLLKYFFVIFTINYLFLQGTDRHTIVCNIIIFFHSIVNTIIHTEGTQEKFHIMMLSVIIWAECLRSNLATFEMLFSQSNTAFQIKY